jgi:serine/threonine protein kinase
MILVPALVLALGVTLTVIGQAALGATSKTMAKSRFVERTSSVSIRVEEALKQSSPIVTELARIAQNAGPYLDQAPLREAEAQPALTAIAFEMRDLLVGRSAITQAYIAFDDGRFLSVDPSEQSAVGFQETHSGKATTYRLVGQALMREQSRDSSYDPRTRDWYRLAQAQKGAVWSSPYAFYFNQHPGVTFALPVYAHQTKTELMAVVGVDFDVDALTHFMANGESNTTEVHSVVFTLGGYVLAYPAGAGRLSSLPRSDRVATYQSLDDPILSALIEQVQVLSEGNRTKDTLRFSSDGETIVASVRKVGAGGPDWYVATFAPERHVLGQLYAHRQSSLAIGSAALLIAMAMGWLLARQILRVRKLAHDAREAAERANAQVRDLGSYRLLSRVGEGGMGEVWRAQHRLLARDAAIKLIKVSPEKKEKELEHRERFRREAQAIAGLRSRNTVALFDYGITADGTLFYVMELLDGIDLNSLVSKHGPQPAERVRQILIQACGSLAEAHAAQLVHRDIKPANLYLCREAAEVDIVKVLDFGLVFQQGVEDVAGHDLAAVGRESTDLSRSRSTDRNTGNPADRITHPDHHLGTPAFMSPEQALGKRTDPRSDIYSLACVAWWLLTGRPIFEAPTHMALMIQHIECDPPSLAPLVKLGISADFEGILSSCLQKAPLDRPQSAVDLGRALRELGEQSPGWSEQQARIWWEREMPPPPHQQPNLSLPPLRDMQLLPPQQAG